MLRILRVLAPNPSIYTLEGTNTWVVGAEPSIVIDPGPPDPGHAEQVRAAAGDVSAVLVTHDHEDHGEGAVAFGELVGAPVYAWRLEGATRLTMSRSSRRPSGRCSPATPWSEGARASSIHRRGTSCAI